MAGSGFDNVSSANLNSFARAHGVGTPEINAAILSAVTSSKILPV